MATEVLLPKLGLTMTEGVITEILVENGTLIAVGDPIMTVGTDKVDIDLEAESAGLFHSAIGAGVTLAPGALLGWILAAGEDVPVHATSPATPDDASTISTVTVGGDAAVPAQPAATDGNAPGPNRRQPVSPNARRVAAELGIDVSALRGTGPGGRVVSEDVEEAAEAADTLPAEPTPAAAITGRMDLKPPLRRLARSLGVDVAQLVPTGPDGVVVRADILAAGRSGSTSLAAPQANPVTRVVPLTGMRGTIARRMHASLQESAQLTHGYHVALDAVVAVREQLKAESREGEAVPSLNDFVVKAAALALVEHPALNATVADGEIRQLGDVHMGLAVAVPDGLYVPVIRYADQLSIVEIAKETRALATAARTGQLSLDQLEGGTFAVTSLGTYGVDFFTPVISPGNVGILGVGQLRDGVRWQDDVPLRTQEITLSLTFDHRAVDGAPAAEYLRTVDRLLSAPLRLLAG